MINQEMEYLTPEQTAKRLQVSVKTLERDRKKATPSVPFIAFSKRIIRYDSKVIKSLAQKGT